ncbi:MAG TPA: hypothetical protein VGB76_21935 [Pyrinomonadaceae bacterium]
MRLPCKTNLEKAWLITSLSVLFLHRMSEASGSVYYSPAIIERLWLEVSMIVLSFPFGGLLMFVLRDALSWCDGCRSLEWMLDWSTLLLAGYIQWFWVLPEILRRRQLTFLNLRQAEESVLPETDPASSLPAHNVSPDVSPVAATTAESLARLPAEFDEAGRSALDRVLQSGWSTPPAPPAHVELIFPSVR